MQKTEQLAALIEDLGSKEGLTREKARRKLVAAGKPAVPLLVKLMSDRHDHLRWEACKALGAIADPSTSSVLVRALIDECMEIRWLAAEALIAIGTPALIPLLQGLRDHVGSVIFRQGAHHVLHALEREHLLDAKGIAVLDTLRSLEPETAVAWAVHEALKARIAKERIAS